MDKQFKKLAPKNWTVKFRSILAYTVMLWVMAFLWKATFTTADKLNGNSDFIVGFVTGTVVSTILAFYFGTSEKSEDIRDVPIPTRPVGPIEITGGKK